MKSLKRYPAQSAVLFTRSEALSHGVSAKQLRGPAVKRITRGVYISPKRESSLALHAQAILRISGQQAYVCGPTALTLLGVDIPWRQQDAQRIHISVPENQTSPRGSDVKLHRTNHELLTIHVDELPSIHPADCWLQIARCATVDDLVCLADALMCRQNPLVTRAILEERLRAWKSRPGTRKARMALELAREGTDSLKETESRLLLVRYGLPCPSVNLPIFDSSGKAIFFLDMAYEKEKLGIEYDGAVHVGNTQRMERDQRRRRWLEDHGWRIITITSADLSHNPLGIVSSVRNALEARQHITH